MHHLGFGGVERRAWELARRAAEHYPVELICADSLFSKFTACRLENLRLRGINVLLHPRWHYRLKRFLEYFFQRRLCVWLATRRPAIVHGQGVNAFAGIASGLPTLACWHGENDLRNGDLLGRCWRETAVGSRHIFAISERIRTSLVEAGVPPARVSVVRNGVCLAEFDAADPASARRKFALAANDRHLLLVGALHPVKRVPETILALARLLRQNRQWKLLVAGEGSERTRIEETVDRGGVGDSVRLLGFQKELLPALYKSADVFLLNSAKENLPIVMLEAMAAGLPGAVVNSGSISEVFGDTKHGFLHDAGDDAAFSRNVERLMNDAELRRSCGEAARRTAKSLDWDCAFEQIRPFYEKLLTGAA